jgi:hypothetical protein
VLEQSRRNSPSPSASGPALLAPRNHRGDSGSPAVPAGRFNGRLRAPEHRLVPRFLPIAGLSPRSSLRVLRLVYGMRETS